MQVIAVARSSFAVSTRHLDFGEVVGTDADPVRRPLRLTSRQAGTVVTAVESNHPALTATVSREGDAFVVNAEWNPAQAGGYGQWSAELTVRTTSTVAPTERVTAEGRITRSVEISPTVIVVDATEPVTVHRRLEARSPYFHPLGGSASSPDPRVRAVWRDGGFDVEIEGTAALNTTLQLTVERDSHGTRRIESIAVPIYRLSR
jgi:hypothetical protein